MDAKSVLIGGAIGGLAALAAGFAADYLATKSRREDRQNNEIDHDDDEDEDLTEQQLLERALNKAPTPQKQHSAAENLNNTRATSSRSVGEKPKPVIRILELFYGRFRTSLQVL